MLSFKIKAIYPALLGLAFLFGSIAVSPPVAISAESAGMIGDGTKRGPITVDSDTMEADNSKHMVVFRGNVVVKEDFTLCTEELTIYYNEKQEIRDIIALGNVRVYQESRVARAQEATYNFIDGTMVLTGSPNVSQCGDKVTGESITFNVKDGTALVESKGGGRVRAVIMPNKDCPKDKVIEKDICRGSM